MTTVHAYAVADKGKPLTPFEYTLGEFGSDQVEIQVESCGICHSDLAMIENEWGISRYPIVPGHEVVGTVAAMGNHVKNLRSASGLAWAGSAAVVCTAGIA